MLTWQEHANKIWNVAILALLTGGQPVLALPETADTNNEPRYGIHYERTIWA